MRVAGTDLRGFLAPMEPPWAPQGVPGTPCKFSPEKAFKVLVCQIEGRQLYYSKYMLCKSTDPPNDVTKPRCTVQYAYVRNLICADLVFYDLVKIFAEVEL